VLNRALFISIDSILARRFDPDAHRPALDVAHSDSNPRAIGARDENLVALLAVNPEHHHFLLRRRGREHMTIDAQNEPNMRHQRSQKS